MLPQLTRRIAIINNDPAPRKALPREDELNTEELMRNKTANTAYSAARTQKTFTSGIAPRR